MQGPCISIITPRLRVGINEILLKPSPHAPVVQLDRALPSVGRGQVKEGFREQRTNCLNHDLMSCTMKKLRPPVAQLDRARPSGGRGQRFESSRVGHPQLFCPSLYVVTICLKVVCDQIVTNYEYAYHTPNVSYCCRFRANFSSPLLTFIATLK